MKHDAFEASLKDEYLDKSQKVTDALDLSMRSVVLLPDGSALLNAEASANAIAAIDEFTATRRRIYEFNGWKWTEDGEAKS